MIVKELEDRVLEEERSIKQKRPNILQAPSESMSKSIAIILKAVMTTMAPLFAPNSDGYCIGQIHRRRRKISYTTADKTYSSNESPPREVNLIVSMHSSALFIVAIQ